MTPMLVAVYLIILHSIDGREISINPDQVTRLTAQQTAQENKLLAGEVHCVIGMADGKFVSVIETCDKVRKLLEGANGK